MIKQKIAKKSEPRFKRNDIKRLERMEAQIKELFKYRDLLVKKYGPDGSPKKK